MLGAAPRASQVSLSEVTGADGRRSETRVRNPNLFLSAVQVGVTPAGFRAAFRPFRGRLRGRHPTRGRSAGLHSARVHAEVLARFLGGLPCPILMQDACGRGIDLGWPRLVEAGAARPGGDGGTGTVLEVTGRIEWMRARGQRHPIDDGYSSLRQLADIVGIIGAKAH